MYFLVTILRTDLPVVLANTPIQPHAHNLDGFFVAKLKIDPPSKSKKARAEKDAGDDVGIVDDDGVVGGGADQEEEEEEGSDVSTPAVKGKGKGKKRDTDADADKSTLSAFNDEDDAELIERSKKKLAMRKGK